MQHFEEEAHKLRSQAMKSTSGPGTFPIKHWAPDLCSAWDKLVLIICLSHGNIPLQEKLVPLFLIHIWDIKWGIVVDMADHSKEFMVVEWR